MNRWSWPNTAAARSSADAVFSCWFEQVSNALVTGRKLIDGVPVRSADNDPRWKIQAVL